MSALAVLFMVLTMGGVVALNVLCIASWVRGPKRALRDEPQDQGQPGA